VTKLWIEWKIRLLINWNSISLGFLVFHEDLGSLASLKVVLETFLFILFINLTFFIYYSIHVSYLKNKTLPLQWRLKMDFFVFVFYHVKIELSPSIRAWENHCDLVKMKSHQFLMRKSFFFFFCENDRKNEWKYVERLTEPRRWQFSLTRMSMEREIGKKWQKTRKIGRITKTVKGKKKTQKKC
jgi:hypothetical protein